MLLTWRSQLPLGKVGVSWLVSGVKGDCGRELTAPVIALDDWPSGEVMRGEAVATEVSEGDHQDAGLGRLSMAGGSVAVVMHTLAADVIRIKHERVPPLG
jgi:hypothetical protein